jgi:peptide methionine sulfoxide reductase msrA/msrB
MKKETDKKMLRAENQKTAVLAAGCFWCVEADLKKIPGVLRAVSGYTGGKGEKPTYENYAALGHREAVEITYYPEKVNYPYLVEYMLRHSDPTDSSGSFGDRGVQYSPAVYYGNEKEKEEAWSVIKRIDREKIYPRLLAIAVLPREKFWPAEDYHQDYAQKNPLRYKIYRRASGRDDFIRKHLQ